MNKKRKTLWKIFIDEYCEKNDSYRLSKKEVIDKYFQVSGEKISDKSLRDNMKALQFKYDRGLRGNDKSKGVFLGLQLIPNECEIEDSDVL
jgi:hypothetical protein